MTIVAKILCEFVEKYFQDHKSRLVLPAPTRGVGEQLQKLLCESGNLHEDVTPLLFVNNETKISEKEGWIHEGGLITKRIGQVVLITQPGQLSRVQESWIGESGGAARQGFGDEWPWALVGEHKEFSFSNFLDSVVKCWTEDESHQAWLKDFIELAIIDGLKGSTDRAAYFFDTLIGRFNPKYPEGGDVRERFLRHCGIPKMREPEELGTSSPNSFVKRVGEPITGCCPRIADLAKDTGREPILDYLDELSLSAKEKDLLGGAIDAFFDSAGSHQNLGTGALAIADCFRGLKPDQWEVLDVERLEEIFNIQQKKSKLEVTLNFKDSGPPGYTSEDEKAHANFKGCEIEIEVRWKIQGGDLKPEDCQIELKQKTKLIDSKDSLSGKTGSLVFKIDTKERWPEPDEKIPLAARIVAKGTEPQKKLSKKAYLYLLDKDTRPCAVVVDSPFKVIYAREHSKEEEPEVLTLKNGPAYLYFLDARDDPEIAVEVGGEAKSLAPPMPNTPHNFRLDDPIDPGLGDEVPVHVDFGKPGDIWLALKSEDDEKRELNIEDELREKLKKGVERKVSELCKQFSGKADAPYPRLGGFTTENASRIKITKLMESEKYPERPFIVNCLRKLDKFDLCGPVWAAEGVLPAANEFESLEMGGPTNDLISRYGGKRKSLLDLFGKHFPSGDGKGKYPLCTSLPTYIKSEQEEIEGAIKEYLAVYEEILGMLKDKESRPGNWHELFVLTYLDCVVGVQEVSGAVEYPYFLLGPWHPLMVAQRYQRQLALYASAKRWLNKIDDEPARAHQFAGIFCDLDGFRRLHALDQNQKDFTNAYVSGTSDPNWCLVVPIDSGGKLEQFAGHVYEGLALVVNSMPRGTMHLTKSYAKRFLEAHPAERRLEIRVCKGLDYVEVVRALEELIYKSNGEPNKYGRQLVGGIHLYLEEYDADKPVRTEWREPPICIYDSPNEQDCLEKYNIDIVLVAPSRELEFSYQQDAALLRVPPRGFGTTSGLKTTVNWLQEGAGEVPSIVRSEVDGAQETGSAATNALLGALEKVGSLVSGNFNTLRKFEIKKNLRASWAVIPGYSADPSAFVQYVLNSEGTDHEKVLWEYNIDLEGEGKEYYILSETPAAFRNAIKATPFARQLNSIISHLGSIGIAIGSETVQTGAKSLGVVGQVGAARLIKKLPGLATGFRVALSDDDDRAGLLIPVDSFQSLLSSGDGEGTYRDKRSDLLAIQLKLLTGPGNEKGRELLVSASSVECKYTGSKYPEEKVEPALAQASQTYSRFKGLVGASRDEDGVLHRLALARLISHGLQLNSRRNEPSERDEHILKAILRGNIKYINPAYECVLVSTENSQGRSMCDGHSYGDSRLWVRLSPDEWPGSQQNEESENLSTVRSKINGLFAEVNGQEASPVGVIEQERGAAEEDNKETGYGAGKPGWGDGPLYKRNPGLALDVSKKRELFKSHGIPVAFLVPTKTGMDKALMDATKEVQDFLRTAGIHDYSEQRQGTEDKKLIETLLLSERPTAETQTSLYRPSTKGGDPRIWVSGLAKYARAGDVLALVGGPDRRLVVINCSQKAQSFEELDELLGQEGPDFKGRFSSEAAEPAGDDKQVGEAAEAEDKYLGEDIDRDGIKFEVGSTVDVIPKEGRLFWPSNTSLNQLNVGIVGDLGTGKTQLVRALMYQVHRCRGKNLRNKSDTTGKTPRFLIFDYNGDYVDEDFLKAMDAEKIEPKNICLNFFDPRSIPDGTFTNPAAERARFVYDTLKKIYSGLGPVQEYNLRESIMSAYSKTEGAGRLAPTIYDVCEEYRGSIKRPDSMLSILSRMVDLALFERDDAKIKPFEELFQKTLVLDLQRLGQDDQTKNMLVVIFLNFYYEYMMWEIKKETPWGPPGEQRRTIDSMLVVDEADSIMKYDFPVLKNILLQGRKFGAGVWLSSQYLSHFSHDNRQSLLTWFIHKVPNVTQRELSGIGLTSDTLGKANRVRELKLHECLYKTFDVDGEFIRGRPFFELIEVADK